MAKQKKCPDCKEMPAWITTFSDLMSLLLTFFVLLLSFSTTSKHDFEKAIGALQGALGVLKGEPILSAPIKMHVPVVKGDITEARPTLKDAVAEIEQEIEAQEQQETVEVMKGPEGVIIRIRDQALFNTGKADIKPGIMPLLNTIGAVISRMPNAVEIEGHTDNVPISNDEFSNNHWLSSARALKVLDVFSDEVGIEPQRLSAVGYGEFKPLVENDSEGHKSQNRRVEIKIRFDEGEGDVTKEEVEKFLMEADLGIQGDE